MPKDYYAILGVSRVADSATIHSAFRALARQYHPDAGSGASTSKFGEALEAYHALSNPARRQQHDIDLGKPVQRSGIVAEPLFAPARANHSMRPATYDLDKLFIEMLRWMESEFDDRRRGLWAL